MTGRCCNYDYEDCYAEDNIFNCGVGWVRMLRNEGKKTLVKYQKGIHCPYNEFSKFRVKDWDD